MNSIFRLYQLGYVGLRLGLAWLAGRFGLRQSAQTFPERVALTIARLGTTFIKFGQALSLRRDVLPDEYIAALQSLQEHAAPFPVSAAIAEIERGFGRSVVGLFARFDEQPLAAASIAQVHAARLHDGREVIVKVRRPDIQYSIDRDMRALRWLVRICVALLPALRRYQPLRLVDEIWRNLRRETDFCQEARNIRRFGELFRGWTAILIPREIEGLICESVLVQERSGGRRVDDQALASDGPRLAQVFVDAYLQQIFVFGVFHGDPHPGNLFITQDGRIRLHDFGLIGYLDRPTRHKLASFTNAFIHQDADWLLDAAIDLGVLGGQIERSEFRQGLSEIVQDYAMRPLKEWSLAEAFARVARLGQGRNIFIPYDLLILMRAMFLAERVVGILDPEFAVLETLRQTGPAVLKAAMGQADTAASADRLKLDVLAAVHDLPAVLGTWIRRLQHEGEGIGLGLRLEGLERFAQHLDRSTNRLSLALITLGLYVAGALLMQHSLGPRIFGELPLLAALAYALALWFTLRLARSISRSGRL